MVKTLMIPFEDKQYKKLQNEKEEAILMGECTNWAGFILARCHRAAKK